MKKIIALMLVVLSSLVFFACDSDKQDAPKPTSFATEPEPTLSTEEIRKDEAYALASEIHDIMCEFDFETIFEEYSDVKSRASQNKNSLLDYGGTAWLASYTSLSQEELDEGIIYVFCGGTEEGYNNTSEEEKQRNREQINKIAWKSDIYADGVWGAYHINGTFDMMQGKLKDLRIKLDYFQEEYSDEYEIYTDMEDCYETIERILSDYMDGMGGYDHLDSIVESAGLSNFDLQLTNLGFQILCYYTEKAD